MNIAFFTDTFLPTINGVVTATLNLSYGLAKEGHHILIFAPKIDDSQGKKKLGPRIDVEYLPSIPAFIYPQARLASPLTPKLIERIRAFKPDIIHLQTSFLVGTGAIFLGKLLKKPIVGSFHTYFTEPEYLHVIGLSNDLLPVSTMLWKFAATFYNQCNAVITPSHVCKDDLIKNGVRRPIHAIPNMVNEGNLVKVTDKKVAALKRTYKLEKQVLLYVGRLSREKSLDVLLDSFAHIRKQYPQTSLFIVGDGPIKQELVSHVNKLNLTKHVVFVGEISQRNLLQNGYYQVGDIFVTTSTSETQGVSMMEAMSFGLPIVGVNKRGVKEMVEDVGILTPADKPRLFADAVSSLLADENKRATLCVKSAQAFQSRYRMDVVTKQYEALYTSLL